ncbi:MAG: murein transglycosylase A [Rhizobiales bacterium]|nr:murein transglycosylase A [Hyphomicrobiales bacterium]
MALRLAVLAFILMTLATPALARASFEAIGFQALAGWRDDDHQAALDALKRSCTEIISHGRGFSRPVKYGGTRADWLSVCRKAPKALDARKFFEAELTPLRVSDSERPAGLFTGYFEPEALGSRTPSKEFSVPIYGKPADLVSFDAKEQKATGGLRYGRIVDGKPRAYFTRREIEQGALAGRGLEIVWVKYWSDAFFIQVQGSARIRFADGSSMRLAFSAKNGLPYTAIGGVLVERGEIAKEALSMQAILAWMRKDGKAARELMWKNESFVFFRELDLPEPELGAPGAQTVQLTPLRSLAVDRELWAFGTPVWVDTYVPGENGSKGPAFRRLMIAQDTGTAIKGAVRGDVFWGWGVEAARNAGHMKSEGDMIVLLPKALARKLLAQQ